MKLLFLVLKKVLEVLAPIRTLLPWAGCIYLVRESPCPQAAHLSNASVQQRWKLSPISQAGKRDPGKFITSFCQEPKSSLSQIQQQTFSVSCSLSHHMPQRTSGLMADPQSQVLSITPHASEEFRILPMQQSSPIR